MLEAGAYSSLSPDKPYSLDATNFKEKGIKLRDAINRAVKGTQSIVHRAYPDKLIITSDQYKILTRRPEMVGQQYEGQQYFMYRSPYNLMEVEVIEKEAPIVTINDNDI